MNATEAEDKINEQLTQIAEASKKAFKKPHPGGRPLKLTPEVQEKICSAIIIGAYPETAAAIAGIRKKTFLLWLNTGANAKSKSNRFKQFCDAVEKAIGLSEMRDIMRLDALAISNPQVIQWRLSRRFPDRWGNILKTELSGPGGGPIEINENVSEGIKVAEARLKLYQESILIESKEVQSSSPHSNGGSTDNGNHQPQ